MISMCKISIPSTCIGVGRNGLQPSKSNRSAECDRDVYQGAEDISVYCAWHTRRLSLQNKDSKRDQRMEFLDKPRNTDINEHTENRVVQANRLTHLEKKQNCRRKILSHITFHRVGSSTVRQFFSLHFHQSP
jgi:hypothetical protein